MNDQSQQLLQENQRLRRAVDELSILNEIATAINTTMELNQLIELIVHKCIKLLKVEQSTVMLLEESNIEKPFHTMIRRADRSSQILPYRLNTQLTGWMLKHQKPLLINDFVNDKKFQSVNEESFPIRSLLSVPLISKGHMIGLLTVFNKKSQNDFSREDQRLLTIIAAQSAQVIENARLYEEEIHLQQIEKEMAMACDIQINLLPKESPTFSGYDIAGKSIPAKVVGGDYFDFIPINENRLAICLGDVSGKGLPAALLMANLQATIRGQTLINPLPKKCLHTSNMLLHERTDPQKFATLFYGVLDNRKNQFCYSNAGHNRPFLFGHNKDAVTLDKAGIMLSFMKDYAFEEGKISFDTSDFLIIYSDGITEAMNSNSDEFGEERLISFVDKFKKKSSQELIDLIIQEVKNFTGEYLQMDDMTLVVIKRNN